MIIKLHRTGFRVEEITFSLISSTLQLTGKVRCVTLTGVDTFDEREDEHDDDDEEAENDTHDKCRLHAAYSCGLEQL